MADVWLALQQVAVITAVVGCFGAAACSFINHK